MKTKIALGGRSIDLLMFNSKYIRALSVLMSICFLSSTTGLTASSTGVIVNVSSPDLKQADLSQRETSAIDYQEIIPDIQILPSELGAIRASYLPARGSTDSPEKYPFVLHIQDAHSNPEAQRKIKAILDWIFEHYEKQGLPSPRVAVEGSAGEIHPEYLMIFPGYEQANEALVNSLLEKGELNGAELFAWERYKQGKSNPVFGAEDPKLYRENLKLFREMLGQREEIDQLFQTLRSALEIAQSRFLNPALRDFLKEQRTSAFLSSSFRRHVRETLGIDFGAPIEQVRLPNLARLIHLEGMESGLNRELAGHEWQVLKGKLQKTGSSQEVLRQIEAFMEAPEDHKAVLRSLFADLLLGLKDTPEAAELKDFPYLAEWVRYWILREEIESGGLMAEKERLHETIAEKLAVTSEEKKLLGLYRDLNLLEKSLHLELTDEEYGRLMDSMESLKPARISERLRIVLKDAPGIDAAVENLDRSSEKLETFFDKALRFYEGAKRRDQKLLETALKIYRDGESGGSDEPRGARGMVILVAGGFHSAGILDLMKANLIPHAVIAPHISQVDRGELYRKVMNQDHADLARYFPERAVDKQKALFFRGLLEVAVPELVLRYKLNPDEIPLLLEKVINEHPVLGRNMQGVFYPAKEKPFLRISVKNPPAPSRLERQTISETGILTSASMYPSLSPFGSGRLADRRRHAADIRWSDGGHAVVELMPATLADQVGGVKVETGPMVDPVAPPIARNLGRLGGIPVGWNPRFRGQAGAERPVAQQPAAIAVAPGSPGTTETLVIPPGARPELRETLNFAFGEPVDFLQGTIEFLETIQRRDFGVQTVPELLEEPKLDLERAMMEQLTALFYRPDLLDAVNEIPVWRFLQLMLLPSAPAEDREAEFIYQKAREALGEFAWLLDELKAPVRIIHPLDEKETDLDGIFPVAGLIAGLNPKNELIFLVRGDAGAVEAQRRDLQRLKLPLHRIRVVSAGLRENELVREVKKVSAGSSAGYTGTLDESKRLLERLGYMRGVSRIHNPRIDKHSALLITAALLRQIADEYGIVSLDELVNRHGREINLAALVERVGEMIRVIRHIAAAA